MSLDLSTMALILKLTFNLSPKIDIALTPGFYFSERNGGDPSSQKVRDHYYNYNIGLKTNFKFNENQNLSISGAFDRYDKFKYYKLLKEDEKVYENEIWRTSSQYNQNLFKKTYPCSWRRGALRKNY